MIGGERAAPVLHAPHPPRQDHRGHPVADCTAGPAHPAWKVREEMQMEKVIVPTVFGFAAMMGLWAIVGAVV